MQDRKSEIKQQMQKLDEEINRLDAKQLAIKAILNSVN